MTAQAPEKDSVPMRPLPKFPAGLQGHQHHHPPSRTGPFFPTPKSPSSGC